MATEAVARPAATIMLLRDGAEGLEVFMVVRHHAIDFASGALVFPGGRVEESDHALAMRDALCPNPDGIGTEAMAFRVAAIRETFEECGVLLARPSGSPTVIEAEQLVVVEEGHRAALNKGEVEFGDILQHHDLQAAPDLLVPFAHWITPAHQPKRYDTHFFLVAAPPSHLAVHDGMESVDSIWISPIQALADTDAGRFKLVFATQRNLEKLSRSATVVEAMEAARASTVVTVLPRSRKIDDKRRHLIIPIEAGYGASEFIVDLPPAS
jgi:8-oxo-dGTP pyrophosphatase MutT (NUDIX family)